MSLNKKLFFLGLFVVLLIASFKYIPFHCNSRTCVEKNLQTRTVLLKNIPISVTLAQTNAEITKGLGGKSRLKENEGMLFVFSKPDVYKFWMKDMKFSIDIVWIENNKVVFIHKSVSPDTYPTTFSPTQPAGLVLELPGGFCDTHGVSVGDSFSYAPPVL